MPRRTSYRAGVPCWIDCLSRDPTAAQDFYRALFGWTFDPGPNPAGPAGGYRLIRCRGEIIGGLGVLDADRTGSWTTYLASKDLAATVAAVRMLGGRIVLPPTPVGRDGTLCLALDTTGTAVGFFCGANADGVVLIDEPGAVVRHQLQTSCLTAAATFYGGLVDGTIEPDGDRARLVIDGRSHADLLQLEAGRAALPGWIPIFGVADLTVATARATVAGGSTVAASGPGAPGRDVLVRDPTGAVLGLTEVRTR